VEGDGFRKPILRTFREIIASTLISPQPTRVLFYIIYFFACATIDRLFSLQSRGVGCSFSMIAKR
jgi:hypothetical protein